MWPILTLCTGGGQPPRLRLRLQVALPPLSHHQPCSRGFRGFRVSTSHAVSGTSSPLVLPAHRSSQPTLGSSILHTRPSRRRHPTLTPNSSLRFRCCRPIACPLRINGCDSTLGRSFAHRRAASYHRGPITTRNDLRQQPDKLPPNHNAISCCVRQSVAAPIGLNVPGLVPLGLRLEEPALAGQRGL